MAEEIEELKDIDIKSTCVDCGQEFTFYAKEQLFFREHGLDPPKRCFHCRRIRRIEKENYLPKWIPRRDWGQRIPQSIEDNGADTPQEK